MMLYPGRLLALLIPFFLLGLAFAAEERQPSPTTEVDILNDLANRVSPERFPPKESQLSWRITNAERLRRGLPLKRPSFAKRTLAPAPSPVFRRSYIQILGTDGNSIGYISKTSPHLVQATADIASALVVQYNSAAASSPVNLALQNGEGAFAEFPVLAAIAPSERPLMAGSAQYVVLGAANETPLNSVPVSGSTSLYPGGSLRHESAIFVVSSSGDLTIQWVNPDGSKPSTYIAYNSSPGFNMYITGDIAALLNAIPGYVQVFLKLVEAP